MLSAVELIKAGRLDEAREVLINEVKSKPADTKVRTLLFQVLSLCGEYDRALKHLDMIGTIDTSKAFSVTAYKDILRAEAERFKVCSLEKLPSFLTDAPPYFEIYWDACAEINKGENYKARELFDKASEMRPDIHGKADGEAFEWIMDADSMLSFFVEAFVHDRYVWIPFESMREFIIEKPLSLLDTIWLKATVTTWEGLTANCFLPATYPGSAKNENELIRLGRLTEWDEIGAGIARGQGQHIYIAGEKDLALLDIREIIFNFSKKD
jgi:type VI secretion system protein ImpE